MTKRMLTHTHSDVDEAALDGVQLVQQLGLPLEKEEATKVAGRKTVLVNHLSTSLMVFLSTGPIVMDGWKNHY